MAKALLGHVGSIPDQRLLEEITLLRSRVRVLQSELDHIRAERAADFDLRISEANSVQYAEPALA